MKRLALGVYVLVGALLLGAWAALPNPLAFREEDERYIRQAVELAQGVAKQTFPGWRPEQSPILLTKGSTNYLVEPDGSWKRLSPPPIPVVANGVGPVQGRNVVILAGKQSLEGALGGLISEMDVAAGSGETALIKGLLRTNTRRLTDQEYLGVVLHELFHLYQFEAISAWLDRMPAQPAQGELWTSIYTDPENNRLQDEEGSALLAAIRAPSDAVAAAEARRFLAARTQRRTYWEAKLGRVQAQALLEWERLYEWVEGLARYIQIRGDGPAVLTEQIGEPVDATFARERVYRLGAGQALVLDRLAPGWQAQAAGGAALTDLLETGLGRP